MMNFVAVLRNAVWVWLIGIKSAIRAMWLGEDYPALNCQIIAEPPSWRATATGEACWCAVYNAGVAVSRSLRGAISTQRKASHSRCIHTSCVQATWRGAGAVGRYHLSAGWLCRHSRTVDRPRDLWKRWGIHAFSTYLKMSFLCNVSLGYYCTLCLEKRRPVLHNFYQ